MHSWFVLAHVLGAFLFVLAHGVSMGAALKLHGERNRDRVMTLLQMSQGAIGIMYIGLVLLLAGGIAAGFSGSFWGRTWLWVALGTLVAVLIAMWSIATPHYMKLRGALALPGPDGKLAETKGPPLSDAEIDALIDSPRPYLLALVGGLGLAIIVWLMVMKPF
jgi:hypothetical protein